MLYKTPTHRKVFGNICITKLVLHAVLPYLLLQIVNNCHVNILVCVSKPESASPRDHAGLFSVEYDTGFFT